MTPHAPTTSRFADWLDARLTANDRDGAVRYRDAAPDAVRAHPTEEHLLPLFVAWGAAGRDASGRRFLAATDGGALALDAWEFAAAPRGG